METYRRQRLFFSSHRRMQHSRKYLVVHNHSFPAYAPSPLKAVIASDLQKYSTFAKISKHLIPSDHTPSACRPGPVKTISNRRFSSFQCQASEDRSPFTIHYHLRPSTHTFPHHHHRIATFNFPYFPTPKPSSSKALGTSSAHIRTL